VKGRLGEVEIEILCANCWHWESAEKTITPETVGTCLAMPPTAFCVPVRRNNIASAEFQMELEIKSAWPPVRADRRCGMFNPRHVDAAPQPDSMQ
jgi:hypothetical protein